MFIYTIHVLHVKNVLQRLSRVRETFYMQSFSVEHTNARAVQKKIKFSLIFHKQSSFFLYTFLCIFHKSFQRIKKINYLKIQDSSHTIHLLSCESYGNKSVSELSYYRCTLVSLKLRVRTDAHISLCHEKY